MASLESIIFSLAEYKKKESKMKEAEILRIITQVTGSEANINNTFYDVGITSYAIKTKLKNALNEKFGLSLYETSLNFGTIAQLVDYLKTQISQIDRATTESYSTSENRGTIKSEDLEKQILTTIAGSLGLTSVKRDNSFEFLGLNKYSNLLNVWNALNKKFSLNLQFKELDFDNVGQLVDYLKARISGKSTSENRGTIKSEDLEKQILTTIAGSLGLASVKRENSYEFLGLNKYSNLLNVWNALNKKFSLNLQFKELDFDNVGQLVDYLKARISGKIKAPINNVCKQPKSTKVKSSINNRKIENNNTSTTNTIKCPNCGYVFEESTGSSIGKSALVFGAGLAAGVLLGGPIGGAIGGYLGQMVSKGISRGVKGTVSGIINRCPKCGTDVKTGDNWFGSK